MHLPSEISMRVDVIADAIDYSDAYGHVGIVAGPQQTVSADCAAPALLGRPPERYLQDTDLSSNTGSSSFANVLWATGAGIGYTAAHEIAHQFLDMLCGMNDAPGKVGVL